MIFIDGVCFFLIGMIAGVVIGALIREEPEKGEKDDE